MTRSMQGVFAVSTTPFGEDGEQDLDKLRVGVERVLEAGVDGILCLGATGEALALSDREREAQVRTVIDTVGDRASVVVGCLEYAPPVVAGMMDQACTWGAHAVMITPPFYGGLTPSAATASMHPVLAGSDLPVMVYNNPHSTGVDLLPEQLAEFTAHDSFWSVKETSGAAARIRELRTALGSSVEVFVGADGIALEGFTQGASGWVAASAWLAPHQCVQLWQLSREGAWEDAVQLWRELSAPLGQIEGNAAFISLIKQALATVGLDQGPVRAPLPTAAPEDVATITESLAKIGRN